MFGNGLRAALVSAGFVALFGWSIAKGILPFIHTDELYYWLTTYQYGFVRRGLFGTFVAPLIGTIDPEHVHLVAAEICLTALLALTGC